MAELNAQLLGGFGTILLFLGLVGSVLPMLPGPFLIWLGAFLWAWADGFERIGWPILLVLGVLTIAAWGSDLFLNTIVSRRAGASWKSIIGAMIGGLVGGLLMTGTIPLIGTLIGAALGGIIGMLIVETVDKRNVGLALRAVIAYSVSMALAAALELTISFGMVGLFMWQAYL